MEPEVGRPCADCTGRCLLLHGKKKHRPLSFFKVMIGDDFAKVMFLPPKFARVVSALVDQRFDLEDSNGQCWPVKLTKLRGSLAFQEGWYDFSLEHGLEIGDFMVFYYFRLHFIVQIYKKSGTEELNFPGKKSKKRSRVIRDSAAKNGSCQPVGKDSSDKRGSSTSVISGADTEMNCMVNDVDKALVCTESYCENGGLRSQPLYNAGCSEELIFVDRDLEYRKAEDKSTFFDLSNFEMYESKPDVSLNCQTEADLGGKNLVFQETVGRDFPSEASNSEELEKDNRPDVAQKSPLSGKVTCNGTSSGNPLTASSAKPRNDKLDNPDVYETAENLSSAHSGTDEAMMPTLASMSTRQFIPWRSSKVPGIRDFRVAFEKLESQSGEMMEVVKKEHVEMVSGSANAAQKPKGQGIKSAKPDHVEMVFGCQNEAQKLEGERMEQVEKEHVEMVLGCDDITQRLEGKGPIDLVAEHDRVSDLPVKNSNNEMQSMVKIEPVESLGLPLPHAADISCLVPNADQCFVELPRSLIMRGTRRKKTDRKIVFLKDPSMRLWPVLFHDTFAYKALTSGWDAVRKANDLRLGDECIFRIDDESTEPEHVTVYRIDVVRRDGGPV